MNEIFQKPDKKQERKEKKLKFREKSEKSAQKNHERIMAEQQKIMEEEKLASANANIKLMLLNSTRAHWVPNKSARQGHKGYRDFGVFRRRHHCRIGGNVFGSNGGDKRRVNYSITIQNLQTVGKHKHSQSASPDLFAHNNTPVRIGDKCLNQYNELQEMMKK